MDNSSYLCYLLHAAIGNVDSCRSETLFAHWLWITFESLSIRLKERSHGRVFIFAPGGIIPAAKVYSIFPTP